MELKIKRPARLRRSLDTYEFMHAVTNRGGVLELDIIFNLAKEHFWVIALNRSDITINLELIALGNGSKLVLDPVEVFSIPIYKRAAGVILVHNHPSGSLEPSDQDRDITDHLIQAGRMLKRPVLDHIILTEHSYFSFKDSGLLRALEASINYVTPYELEAQLQREMENKIKKVKQQAQKKVDASLQKGIEQGVVSKVREVAQKLLALKLDLVTIQQATGLTKSELEGILQEKQPENSSKSK